MLEVEKDNNRLVNLSIEKESRLITQYMAHVDDERKARKMVEVNMRDYFDRKHDLKEQVTMVQFKLKN